MAAMSPFRTSITEYIMPSYSPFLRPFKKHGGFSKVIRLSQKLRSAEPSILTMRVDFVGRRFQKKGVAEYIMPSYPPFWRPLKKPGGHFQSNKSIAENN